MMTNTRLVCSGILVALLALSGSSGLASEDDVQKHFSAHQPHVQKGLLETYGPCTKVSGIWRYMGPPLSKDIPRDADVELLRVECDNNPQHGFYVESIKRAENFIYYHVWSWDMAIFLGLGRR